MQWSILTPTLKVKFKQACTLKFEKYNLQSSCLLQKRHDYQRRKSIEEMAKFKQRRSSELYMSFKEARQQIEKEARESSVTIEEQWQQQGM